MMIVIYSEHMKNNKEDEVVRDIGKANELVANILSVKQDELSDTLSFIETNGDAETAEVLVKKALQLAPTDSFGSRIRVVGNRMLMDLPLSPRQLAIHKAKVAQR
jgi:hypothetical protein